MNNFIKSLVLGFTLLNFCTLAWYTHPLDAKDTMMFGFPFPYLVEGWHTSMSYQYFLVEFLVDLIFYSILSFIILKILKRIEFKKSITSAIGYLCTTAFLIVFGLELFIAIQVEHVYCLKKEFNYEVIDKKVHFYWENPNILRYEYLDIVD